MAMTPQSIREQKFSTRFRGCAPAEVKEFLEALAEEFQQLAEKADGREEMIAELNRRIQAAGELNKVHDAETRKYQQDLAMLQSELSDRVAEEAQMADEMEQLRDRLDESTRQLQSLDQELGAGRQKTAAAEEKFSRAMAELETLRVTLVSLEAENQKLKKEEAEFNRTLSSARQIADDLIDKSRQDSQTALQLAQDEIQRFRQSAFLELSQIRDEIEQLTRQRWQVREDLRATLNRYLDGLQESSGRIGQGSGGIGHDYDELFEKIEFPEIAAFAEDDETGEDLPTEFSAEFDDEEDLTGTLQDGGVAYLSDEKT